MGVTTPKKNSKPKEVKKKEEKQSVKEVVHESPNVSFETTEKVEFNINGQKFEGTHFSFPREVVEARKKMLVEAYGKDIITK